MQGIIIFGVRELYDRIRNPPAIAVMLVVIGEILLIRPEWLWLMLPLSLVYREGFARFMEHKGIPR